MSAIAAAVLLERPDVGLVRLVRDRRRAGRLLRSGLPVIILGPFLLGWLRLWAQREGWFDAELGDALLVSSTIGRVLGVAWIAAGRLRALDVQRDGAFDALAVANATLENAVHDRTRELARTAERVHALIRIVPVGIVPVGIVPVGIVQFDASGGVTTTNEQWMRMTGLSVEASRGDGWGRNIHAGDAKRVPEAWRKTVSTGSTRHSSSPPGLTVESACSSSSTRKSGFALLSAAVRSRPGTSRSSTCRTRGSRRLRPWRAGGDRESASSRRAISSRSPRRPG
ncbi:PAS domain-containing protein [Cryobacterium psychrotolerans]|nr:PAS domain-containing protein [Cryobacterium psychrotolerans]